jgi:undecaprenyl diphosphate synthase
MPNETALPAHVAIIMDGNGRWAKQRGLPRSQGHKQGAKAFRTSVSMPRISAFGI